MAGVTCCHDCGEPDANIVAEDDVTGDARYLCSLCEAIHDGKPVADCEQCGRATPESEMWHVETLRQTHSSPAEYAWRCLRPGCATRDPEDEAYDRAAANFDDRDGEKDWR